MGRRTLDILVAVWLAAHVAPAPAVSCGPAADPASAAVRGRVQHAVTGRGIANATVVLEGAGRRFELTTPPSGLFRFPGLPPGDYRVTAKHPGNVTVPESSTAVKLQPRACAEVVIRMQPDRGIYGRVFDEDGKPAARVRLALVPVGGLNDLSERNSIPVVTGEDGSYSFRNVAPGQYYLGVNVDRVPWPSDPYPRYFFPGTEDVTAATIVRVPEDLPLAADLELPRRQAERSAYGVVVWPDGRPAPGATIFLEDPHYPSQILVLQAKADQQGAFSIKYYDSTRYIVYAVNECKQGADCRSADPYEILPGMSPSLRLVLKNKGHAALEAYRKAIGAQTPARP